MKDVLRQLLRDVRSEKLRTFLTVFGIVWGTVAISLMLAFGTGLHKQLIKSTAGLGDRIVIAWPGLTSIPYEGLGKGRRIRITDDDIGAIENDVQGLKGISGEYDTNLKVEYGTKTLPADTSGVSEVFGSMRNLIPQEGGRFINPIDVHDSRRVAFLGDRLATNLFGEHTPPVGKMISVNQSPFLIVGVLTLIVGGIGVSNIMNVVVEERTREIGIKMALGAKQSWILRQFLLETLVVTALGGAFGFLISLAICALFPQQLVEYVGQPTVSPLVAALTAVALGLVGL